MAPLANFYFVVMPNCIIFA